MDVEPDMAKAMKSFMRVPRYGQAVGRVMVREARVLNWQRIERVIEADYEGAVNVLLETDFGPYLERAGVAREIEEGLRDFLRDQYAFLDQVCAGTRVAEFMHLKYDFHNMKVLLKQMFFGASEDKMLSGLGSIDTGRMAGSLEQKRSGNLPPYWEDLLERLKGRVAKGGGPQKVDTLADREFLERRLWIARAEKSKFLVDFSRAAIDVANLRLLLRARELDKSASYFEEALAEGGRLPRRDMLDLAGQPTDRLSARLLVGRYGRMLEAVFGGDEKRVRLTSLDRDSDEYLLEKIARMKRISIGPERIVSYMIKRENEATLLRIILMGKLHGLSARAIEKRVSPIYLMGGA